MSMALQAEESDVTSYIRGQQAVAIEQNAAWCSCGMVIVSLVTTVLFWRQAGQALWFWCPAAMVASYARLLLARHRMKQSDSPGTVLTTRWLGAITFGLSSIILSGPIWIQMRSDGVLSEYMMALYLGIFWCGAFAHSAVRSASVSFILGFYTLVWGSSILRGLESDSILMLLLYGIGTIIALYVTMQQAAQLENSLKYQFNLEAQKKELSKQADLIGLLLKEHEDQSSDWLWQTDEAFCLQNPSLRFGEAFCLPIAAIEGVTLATLLSRSDQPGLEDALVLLKTMMDERQSFRDLVIPDAVEKSPRWWSISGRPILDQDGRLTGYRGVMSDVTAARLAQSQVVHMARHDPLTNLPIRAYFRERVGSALRSLGTGQLTLISIDLDGFTTVNDRYGYPVGDAILVEVAERLRSETADIGLVARLGSDEFAIKARVVEPGEVEALCSRLLQALSEPFRIDDSDIAVGASIGVAFAPQDGDTTNALFKNSDAALRRAKSDCRGTFRFFAADMDQRLQERLLLQQDLRDALARDELTLHYQPFINAETGAVTGCEALIRWRHPARGLVSPIEFIPIAEETGLIVPIGTWVIERACAEAATWPGERRVSVNISPLQFRDRDLPDRILDVLLTTRLPAHRLEVEVTETVLISDAATALDTLRRIRALGVRVALDDFGTGYSSLSYLCSFPFDKVKIDRSFVREIVTRRDSQVIVQAIRDIARGLGITITAEGVETAEQAELLRTTGCQELQGFLYSRPCTADEVTNLFDQPFAVNPLK